LVAGGGSLRGGGSPPQENFKYPPLESNEGGRGSLRGLPLKRIMKLWLCEVNGFGGLSA